MPASTSSTPTTDTTVTDHDLDIVRDLLRSALDAYAAEHDEWEHAGVTASDLANNVRGWTHTTRLRDFVESIRKDVA